MAASEHSSPSRDSNSSSALHCLKAATAPRPQVVSDQQPFLIAPSPGTLNLLDAVVLVFGFGLLQLFRDSSNVLVPGASEPALLPVCARSCHRAHRPGRSAVGSGQAWEQRDANARRKHSLCKRSQSSLACYSVSALRTRRDAVHGEGRGHLPLSQASLRDNFENLSLSLLGNTSILNF